MNYKDFCNKIINKENISISRYGDGELGWLFLAGNIVNLSLKRGDDDYENIFKCHLKLKESIEKVKKYKNFHIALQCMGYRMFTDSCDEIFKDSQLLDVNIMLHQASMDSDLQLFVDSLKDRSVILVGGQHLQSLNFVKHHIKTPDKKVWRETDWISEEIQKIIQPNDVVLYCASAASNICMADNYRDDITQIDCGSVFDPYCGIKSRRYHKTLKVIPLK